MAAACCLAAVVAAAGGQEPEESAAPEEFFGVIDVEIVNVDVWVSDKRGRPVPGLTRDDFIVLQDRQPIEISNFYAVSGGLPVEATATVPPAAEPSAELPPLAELPDVAEQGLPGESPSEQQLWTIVYVDNYNLDPIERNRVLPALANFLDQTMRGGDRAMIVKYSRSLEVIQPFTDRMPDLMATLGTIVDDAGFTTIRRREQVETLESIDRARSVDRALGYARTYAEEQMNGVQYTVDALHRLIDTLAGLPGRKALVHVSSGVSMLAGEEMFHAVAEKFDSTRPYGEIPRHDTTRRFEALARYANANRVALHTLDAGGLRGMEFGAAEYGGFVTPDMRRTLDSVVPENLHAPLRLMANETGGRAILNRNEVQVALDEVATDLRSYYALGIQSTGTDSGRYHELEVKLRDGERGWRVRHRGGYTSKNLDARVRESLRSALLYDHQSNPLDVGLTWGRAERDPETGHYLLPIKLRIPLRDTVLLPVAGAHEARLRLFVAAVGEDGAVSAIQDSPLGVRLAAEHVEAAKQEALEHTHRLLVNSGPKKVGVAVLDLFGLQTSVVTGLVQLGPPAESP